jgi:hypothetical protein|tara:strand:- start:106 stop:402 length:297 start_codon:yes stop_codon:yes gene_type:complete
MDVASIVSGLSGSGWFEMAGKVVLVFTFITGLFPDKVISGIPVIGKLWPIANWLAGNVFNNVNHPKGVKALKEVEDEIDEAKKKVPERVGIADTLDGV